MIKGTENYVGKRRLNVFRLQTVSVGQWNTIHTSCESKFLFISFFSFVFNVNIYLYTNAITSYKLNVQEKRRIKSKTHTHTHKIHSNALNVKL